MPDLTPEIPQAVKDKLAREGLIPPPGGFSSGSVSFHTPLYYRKTSITGGTLNSRMVSDEPDSMRKMFDIAENPDDLLRERSALAEEPALLRECGVPEDQLRALAAVRSERDALHEEALVAIKGREEVKYEALTEKIRAKDEANSLLHVLPDKDARDRYVAHYVRRHLDTSHGRHAVYQGRAGERGAGVYVVSRQSAALEVLLDDPAVAVKIGRAAGGEPELTFGQNGRPLELHKSVIDVDETLDKNAGRRAHLMSAAWKPVPEKPARSLPVPGKEVTLYAARGQKIDLADARAPELRLRGFGSATYTLGADTAVRLSLAHSDQPPDRDDEDNIVRRNPPIPFGGTVAVPARSVAEPGRAKLAADGTLTLDNGKGGTVDVAEAGNVTLRLLSDDGKRHQDIDFADKASPIRSQAELDAAVSAANQRLAAATAAVRRPAGPAR